MFAAILLVVQVSALVACVGLWIRQFTAARRFVPLEPSRSVPWGLLHVALAFVGMGALGMIGMQIVQYRHQVEIVAVPLVELPQEVIASVLVAECLAKVVLCVALVAVVRLACGAGARDFGWDAGRFGSDLRLGLVWFVMLVPPVLLVHAFLQLWFVSEHPLVKLVERKPDLRIQALVILSAVVVAPLVEEFLYRGVLQGWLEKLAARPDDTRRVLMGDTRVAAANGDGAPRVRARWPVAAGAMLFALMHWSHGPDWVPLFLLGCGLGYLYRQTHRILPGIVVHFLLNAWSMLALWLVERG